MNTTLMTGLALMLASIGSSSALADVLREPEIAPRESGIQRIRYADRQTTLYNYRWELVREGRIVTVTGRGDNDRQGDRRVEWIETSRMEIGPDGLRTLDWSKESSGAEQESWRIRYDWQARTGAYSYHDRSTGRRKEKSVTFGPGAFASDAMYFLLRGFPFEAGMGTRIEGEFILTDGRVVRGVVIHDGEGRIETAFGRLDAYRLEFRPAGLVGAFAPRMFIWYTKTKPHLFVRFDGRDDGILKPRTVNELIRYQPAGLIGMPEIPPPDAPGP